MKVAIVEAGESREEIIKRDLDGVEPTVTITVAGAAESGRSSIAGIMRNSIRKNLIDTGRFTKPGAILIEIITTTPAAA